VTAQVGGLNRVAEKTVGSVRDWAARRTQHLREWVAGGIMLIFVVANGVTFWTVFQLAQVDQDNMAAHLIMPTDCIITNQAVITLLDSTAVQVGAIAVVIARYLFPGGATPEERC
jgi:hypothetical protein